MKHILMISLVVAGLFNYSKADEDDLPKRNPNAPRAIEGKDKDKGFKLSVAAVKRLGIKTAALQSASVVEIPQEALLYHQDEVGIYLEKDGWFRLVDIEIVKRAGTKVLVESRSLDKSLRVVIAGVPLLRVAELDAEGGIKDMD